MGAIQSGAICNACVAPEPCGHHEGVAAAPRGEVLYGADAVLGTHEDVRYLGVLAPERPSALPRFNSSDMCRTRSSAVETPMTPGPKDMRASSLDSPAATGLTELAMSLSAPAAIGLPRIRLGSEIFSQLESKAEQAHVDLDRKWYDRPSVGTWLLPRACRVPYLPPQLESRKEQVKPVHPQQVIQWHRRPSVGTWLSHRPFFPATPVVRAVNSLNELFDLVLGSDGTAHTQEPPLADKLSFNGAGGPSTDLNNRMDEVLLLPDLWKNAGPNQKLLGASSEGTLLPSTSSNSIAESSTSAGTNEPACRCINQETQVQVSSGRTWNHLPSVATWLVPVPLLAHEAAHEKVKEMVEDIMLQEAAQSFVEAVKEPEMPADILTTSKSNRGMSTTTSASESLALLDPYAPGAEKKAEMSTSGIEDSEADCKVN